MLARLALFVPIVLAGCRKEPAAPAAAPVPGVQATAPSAPPALVERGRYVATISGCIVCHTPMIAGSPDAKRLLAGGFEERMNGGIWRSPNITPDQETGIGTWSDEEIIEAIRRGIGRGGEKLLPIMPYPYFHRMTDDDAHAVVAFLRAQKPIVHKVLESKGLTLQPIDLPEPIANDDPIDDPKAHGAYLASLMHCEACHTPQAGPWEHVAFVGGVMFALPGGGTILSANITSDPETGIGRWTEAQIIQAIRTMKKPDGTSIEGPMALYGDAWSKLTDRDAHALAVFVHSIPAVPHEVPDHQHAVSSRL
jgi:mono/diheme cytochrome c family protein